MAANCECDYDAQGDPLEYIKTSHYCPLHDDCEQCGELLGVAKDPAFPNSYDTTRVKRAWWMCRQCLDEQCPVCGIDIEGCPNGGKCVKPEPTIADFERAVYEAKVKGGKA